APAVPFMEANDAYIRQYPPALRQRLAIIAANHAIRQKDYKTPIRIFESLEADGQDKPIANYIQFLRARIAADTGKPKDAKQLWQELANNIEDRQFRARAGFALTLLQLEEDEI